VAATEPPIVDALQVIVAVAPERVTAGLPGAVRVVMLVVTIPDPVVVR
jgi:hypothetical protein